MKRRISYSLAAAVVAAALLVVPANADKRSDALAEREKAQKEAAELQSEVEGLSSELAQVYIDLREVSIEIPAVEAELAGAREAAAAAERHHQQVKDQLTAATQEYERLTTAIEENEGQEVNLSSSVATMARDLYRGGETSPLTLLLTTEGPGDIGQRVTAAETVARAQSRALEAAREEVIALQNQASKQDAMTERIAGLEAEAAAASEEAAAAEASVDAKLDELTELQASLSAKETAWESRKAEAIKELEAQENAVSQADKIIAEIDAENRRLQEEADRQAAAEQAANEPNTGGSAPTAPSSPPPTTPSGGLFSWPAPAGTPITSSYGMRFHPVLGIWRLHDGTDFGLACGQPQYAAADGVVAGSFFDSGGGNMVIINHGNMNGSSWATQHLHLSSSAVSTGQSVSRGQVIGYTGTTGTSTGCHMHFTITKDGSTVNPMDYLG